MHIKPVILAISGKKQSGKGKLYEFIEKCNHLGGISCKEFSFAAKMKWMCIDILGLEYDQVFGTDEQKNSKVGHLLWENFPLPVYQFDDGQTYVHRSDDQYPFRLVPQENGHRYIYRVQTYFMVFGDISKNSVMWPRRKTGPMTGREVLQYWGTEIFRKQNPDVWADACMRSIGETAQLYGDGVCVITDCRFPNEVEVTKRNGGYNLRLTRNKFDDRHESEIALDQERFDWNNFDIVIDNKTKDIYETCLLAYGQMLGYGIVPRLTEKDVRGIAEGISQ